MGLNAEINVVSLIDVMMLLMVIFMITAPIMQGGIDINLPKAEARPLEPKSGLVVTVDRNGGIHVDEMALTYAEFRATFKTLGVGVEIDKLDVLLEGPDFRAERATA